MSGSDNLNLTTQQVGAAVVAGSTTALAVVATPYSMTSNDSVITVDASAGAVTVNLPNIDRNAVGAEGGGPSQHPLRGRTVTVCRLDAAANIVSVGFPSSGTVQAAPTLDGSATNPNVALLPVSLKRSVTFLFDGLNWVVLSARNSAVA